MDVGWIDHTSYVNCPFKTIVYDADLNVAAGSTEVDIPSIRF